MQTKILTTCAAGILLLTALLSRATTIPSPNLRWLVDYANNSIQVIDQGIETPRVVCIVVGDTNVDIKWSPFSDKVVVLETGDKGRSDIVAAWVDKPKDILHESVWHKSVEMDKDQDKMIDQAERKFGGKFVSQTRTLGSWVSENAIQVKGELTFTNGRKCGFTYILEFGQGPVHVSPAGFEVGAIVGKDFQLLSH
jgi:hypothetical protein